MQCADGELILASQFCDFSVDCGDYSDEYNVIGVKCNGARSDCYLPQINLFDDAAHCKNGFDLGFKDNTAVFSQKVTIHVFEIIEVLCFSQLRKILIVNFCYDVVRNLEKSLL